MKKTAILFDQDGTLTDSGPGIIRSARLTLAHFGIEKSYDDLRVFVGPPLEESFLDLGIQEKDLQEAIHIYREEYETKGLYENKPYPGIIEMLKELRNNGYPLYIVTSKDREVALRVLSHFDMAKYFQEVYGTDKRKKVQKSKAELMKDCLDETKKLGLNAIMVGDTKFDINGANSNKIPSVAVLYGYGSRLSIEEAKPTFLAKDVQELEKILSGL